MNEEQKINCKDVDCQVNGFFYKDLPDGTTVICIPGRHHKEKHVRELKLPEGVKRLEPV